MPKYKDIDIKTARKCCKQHSYKNNHGMTIVKCETCPLRRMNTNGKPGMCWYMLKTIVDTHKYAKCKHEKDGTICINCEYQKQCADEISQFEYLKAEYDALMQEDVKEILEWENWINSQGSLD